MLTFTSARKQLKSVFDKATEDSLDVLIERRKGENVVIMSEKEYNSWKETAHLLSNPANAQHLKESIKELEEGKTLTYNLDEL